MKVLNPITALVTPWGFALSDSEKTEELADNLKAQFLPVTDPSFRPVIETVTVTFRSYIISPSSRPQITIPDEIHEAVRELKESRLRARKVYRDGQ